MRTVYTSDGRATIVSPYLSLAEAAIYCGCTEAVLTGAMATRTITYYQFVDQVVVFSCYDLDAYIEDCQVLSRYNYLDDAPPVEDDDLVGVSYR